MYINKYMIEEIGKILVMYFTKQLSDLYKRTTVNLSDNKRWIFIERY